MRPGQPAPLPASSPVEAIDHEFSFSRADFDRVRQLIYQHAGISLHDGKHAMVYSRLSRRLRDTGHKSFASYLQWLEGVTGPQGDQEWQEFVNCLTTNLTSFFREEHHFHALTEDLKTLTGKPLRIWCCAASTGEEPYSIAMTCQEALGSGGGVQIISSDIDTNVLNTARRGVYAGESRGLSPQRLRQFFLKGTGANEGRIRVKPDLARMIEFRPLNLMDATWSLGEPFHIVFCRNVMIYFDAPTQRKVLERIHKVMRPGGLLFVGHSENFTDSRDLFRLRGKTIYERVG
ncbi:chemotaxis protein CheR [Roseateles aquatilis]|uniref:Chemotaxis protein methyltransferase n=1 Tax=Roseateles aquatilis TaxID=431061 RepID=A0A246JKP1_9BURK|nr:CheR family methyltransferase [Roseateles aquatilis]OWQ93224.1 chemotaxis protein CheR [Roseateles aquatilis]